jgi:NAD(P)-dependent dehydrogenase (short-subunit alcohol dehydrogenase family)
MVSDRFTDKVAIITGSSKGIGLAIATRLATEGAKVVLNARRDSELSDAAAAIQAGGAEVATVAGSLAQEETLERLVGTAVDRFGGIDLIVNNVGVSPLWGPLIDPANQRDLVARTFMVNAWAPVDLITRALAAGWRSPGAVVNISSLGARLLSPLNSPYCASKAALELFTRTMARELGPRGYRANAVAPGIIQTDMSRIFWEEHGRAEAALLPLQRLGSPEDIAAAAVFLLSDDASWITGVVLDVDGGRMLVGGEPRHMIGTYDNVEAPAGES